MNGKMLPRTDSRCWIVGAGLTRASCWAARRRPEPRTVANVLLVGIDTLRSDYLGAYGSALRISRIDALAGRSVVFRHAVSSNPITLPAHSTLLTGLHPTRHEVHDNTTYRLSESHVTLADSSARTASGRRRSSVRRCSTSAGARARDSTGTTTILANPRRGVSLRRAQRGGGDAAGHHLDFLRGEAKERFLFVHYYDPHQEWNAPAQYALRFPDNGYAAEVAYTDAQLGVLFDALDELGLADSTLVVVTADHGESLGAFGELSHAFFVYQVTQSVPLIVHVPGMRRRRDVDRVAGLVDVVPTVLAQLSLERPAQLGAAISRPCGATTRRRPTGACCSPSR